MIKIISVEREYGCGGSHIAQSLADRLGWKLWDQEITDEIARRLKCKAEMVQAREERCDSMFYRLIKTFMRGSFEPRIDTAKHGIAGCRASGAAFREGCERDCRSRQLP